MTHPPGTIVLLGHETARFSATWQALLSVQHPEGTRIVPTYGADIAFARNQGLREAHGEWVWFMDDDHTWRDPRILLQLLDREVDIVQPLVLRRMAPFSPVVTRHLPDGTPYACDVHELGPAGLVNVESCGMGGTLIRRHVWEALEAPWFRVGQVVPDKLGEDVYFTRRVRAAGFDLWVDLDHPIDHCRVCALRPQWKDGQWWTVVALDDLEVCIPAVRREKTPAPDPDGTGTLMTI